MTADLLSREWPLAPMLGTFTHESTHVQNFLLALLVRIQILRTVCTDEIARKLPRNGCRFLLVAFYQCNCDGQFCIHLIGSQGAQMLGKHFRGSVNIFLGENNIWMGRLGEGDFPFATDMYQSLCWGLKQKEEGREERIHTSYVISCAGVLVFASLDHLPSSFKHF